ncbi:hypothetical protein IC620_09560 [Hazenella sp. IB182357]|uniref:Uncharacterized protein n=1 Tax=Polycladospora coralii TaxID=2771432 RepID=A0A926RTB1_9BACL|nr:hypothetical protein [Polycladospora coralii]MBD1372600.1 hypothetical protein [Polycladospora coralii]MBS7531296.1 hypothetical protein [Polycladospora coralii]
MYIKKMQSSNHTQSEQEKLINSLTYISKLAGISPEEDLDLWLQVLISKYPEMEEVLQSLRESLLS